MNPLTIEWVAKAEGDYGTAGRELRARKFPNYDAVCFHCQQVAEKYLKAFLQENGLSIPKTHILLDLLALCLRKDPSLSALQLDLNILEGYATVSLSRPIRKPTGGKRGLSIDLSHSPFPQKPPGTDVIQSPKDIQRRR